MVYVFFCLPLRFLVWSYGPPKKTNLTKTRYTVYRWPLWIVIKVGTVVNNRKKWYTYIFLFAREIFSLELQAAEKKNWRKHATRWFTYKFITFDPINLQERSFFHTAGLFRVFLIIAPKNRNKLKIVNIFKSLNFVSCLVTFLNTRVSRVSLKGTVL
jgi:hypothetical protein